MLIKSDAGIAVRSFVGGARPPAEAREMPAPDPRDIEQARLVAELERLQRQRAEDEAAAKRAVAVAREEGRQEGLAQAERREADGIAALRQGLERARADLGERLGALDRLAPELARAALARMFADSEDRSALVEAMIARQLAALRRSSVIAIHLSPEDFPDIDALAALSAGLGAEGVRIETDRALRAGASRIECRLGQIDLDMDTQWQALSALLAEMAG
ncbi:FliH/SctL family protein [Sphingomonas sp. CBMAI 2297]|uniref:FliH/SctL family protein n=1 Tax=Sphingomonas sp. CBMAI 2297 TaxID=2991720 RepID=UPI002458876D|nr:FliH/SctL family protein [Sphingomonas sp. CBMAI 2297]MDH4744538.1 FliH/SctL family protein [Sphingomonas sp. CBMAI 2297]